MLPNSSEAGWLAVIRIYTGVFWLIHGTGKLISPQFASPAGMFSKILQDMMAGSSGPYHEFLVNTVLPHASTFAHLVAWGETLTGVSLLLGLLSRVGGIGGMFLTLNYMLAQGELSKLNGYAGLDAAAFALSFLNLVLPTGMRFGLDGLLFGSRSAKNAPGWARS